MTYIPRRDYRFEYIWEAMSYLEDHQCSTCKFAEPGEYPMCIEVASFFLAEEPVEAVDDNDDEGIECRKYESF